MRAPGLVVLSRTHWQRMAPASPASRCARTCAHGLPMSMMRLPGRSVSGRAAASRARSIPYRAMSSAAFAVSASASGGVAPSASAFASSLRTRSSRALGGSECIRNLQVDPVELSIELYPRHTTFRRHHPGPPLRRPGIPAASRHSTLGFTMAVQISPSVLSADFARLADEAVRAPVRTLRAIRTAGARAGLALNPGTPVEHVTDLLPEVDMLLLMTVEPGFGGQPFLDMVLPKLRRARALVGGRDAAVWLQVDGGVSEETIERCAEAGADVFVAGSAVYGSDDPGRAVQALRAQAERATAHAAWGRPSG